MVSLIKKLTGNTPNSERRPFESEITDRFLEPQAPRNDSPFKIPKMDLAKFVTLNNASKVAGFGAIPDSNLFCDKDRILKLSDLVNNNVEDQRLYLHKLNQFQEPVKSKSIRLKGTSNCPESAKPNATPASFDISKPVFEDQLGRLCGRRSSCFASIRVTPLSENAQKRRLAAKELSTNLPMDLKKLLGAGGFGSVYKGMIDCHMVAVKQFHGKTKNEKAKAESIRAEGIAKSLQHPNIVRILGTWRKEDAECVVMEYVGDMNLQQLLNSDEKPLDLLRRIRYTEDIVSALAFIHSQNLVHLDVKPANILVTPYDSCKLGDFGCCQMLENGTGRVSPTQRSYLTGTFAYRAPELLRGDAPCPRADIYSLGITLWQMSTRELPYSGQNQYVVVFGVVAYNLRPDSTRSQGLLQEDEREGVFRDLYVRCWSGQASARPCATFLQSQLGKLKACLLTDCPLLQ